MSNEQPKFDRFKPSAPKIPGVSEGAQVPPVPTPEEPKGLPKTWLIGGGAAVVVLLIMIVLVATLREPAPAPTAGATSQAAPAEAASPAATTPGSPAAAPPAPPPVAPGAIATVQELSKPWSAKKFIFRKAIGSEEMTAMIVRLPSGAPRTVQGYWAFSLGRTGSECELQYIANLRTLASEYAYRAEHPMVVDPCNRSVYDPLRLGDIGGAWVRGDVVKGPAYRPPLSILVKIEGNTISAVQME